MTHIALRTELQRVATEHVRLMKRARRSHRAEDRSRYAPAPPREPSEHVWEGRAARRAAARG